LFLAGALNEKTPEKVSGVLVFFCHRKKLLHLPVQTREAIIYDDGDGSGYLA